MSGVGRYGPKVSQALGEAIRPGLNEAIVKASVARARALRGEAPPAPPATSERSVGAPGADAISRRPALAHVGSDALRRAEEHVRNLSAVQDNLNALLQQVSWAQESVDGLRPGSWAEDMGVRLRGIMAFVGRLDAALDAAGPEVKALFPLQQLEALREAAKVDEAKLQAALQPAAPPKKKRAPAKRALDAQDAEAPAPKARPSVEGASERFSLTGSGTGAKSTESVWGKVGGFFRREPAPIPEAVALKMDALVDAGTTAGHLASILGAPELEGQIKAALERAGPARAKLEAGLKGFALLADAAAGTVDYARVGVGMFGHPECRRSHQARKYGRLADPSADRQQASRARLRDELKAALAAPAPAEALAALQGQAFLREIGVPAPVAAGFAPKPEAVTQALKDELFAPLRALNETIHTGRYRGFVGDQLLGKVHELTQAVVEGRYDAWRVEHPASQAQLAHLSEAQQQAWLQSSRREKVAPGGAKLVTREAEGHELFWATKVGGPSHAFDTMNWCILSLLGNARTKAIVLEDGDWHQTAARAYLRLMKDEDGKPVVYLDPTQIDFPHREHHPGKRNTLEQAILEHAVGKAKALGASLAVTSGPWGLRDMGLAAADGLPRRLVLEPNRMLIEASDTMGRGHDWVQSERELINPRVAYVSAEKLAAWNAA